MSNIVHDDLSVGKSCHWTGRRWHCRDCGTDGNCKILKRKRDCAPFRRQEWDNPPRSKSHFHPRSNSSIETRTLTKFGVGKVSHQQYQNQPQCTVLALPCFDLTRCNSSVLTIYTNHTGPHELLDFALSRLNETVVRVDNYRDACLVLVTRGMYPSSDQLYQARHWEDGKNTLLYESECFFDGIRCDSPFSSFDYGYAALASGSLTRAHYREGYDLTLPLPRLWGRDRQVANLHRPRTWLVTFRGSIQNTLHPYYQHRWLAAEYWEDAPDVLVDVQCKHLGLTGKRKVVKPYRLPASVYDELMWNSTFGFCPGGSGVGSYRFGEVLSTGGIPVVTQDFVPPLSPDVDWSKCLVRVSEARIVDLPRLLRQFSPKEIERRQRACWHLLKNVIGDKKEGNVWKEDRRLVFAKVLQVWAIRIRNALQSEQQLLVLNQEIQS